MPTPGATTPSGLVRAADHDPRRLQRPDGQDGRAAGIPRGLPLGRGALGGLGGRSRHRLLLGHRVRRAGRGPGPGHVAPPALRRRHRLRRGVNVERTVRLYEEAGAAGLHLEDQVMPKRCGHLTGKALVEPERWPPRSAPPSRPGATPTSSSSPGPMPARSRDSTPPSTAPQAYLDAGADMIFPEALESAEEFARFAEVRERPLLANMTEFGRAPCSTSTNWPAMGYRAVLYPLTAFRAAACGRGRDLARPPRHRTQRGSLRRMQTRAELYDLLGYTDWEARDRAYFSVDPARGRRTRREASAPPPPGN